MTSGREVLGKQIITLVSEVGKMPILEFFRSITYRSPAYIQLAAKRKVNLGDIFIVGVTDEELEKFRKSMKYHALDITKPQ